MKKKERIAKYGEAAYLKMQEQSTAWNEAHPEEVAASHREESNKGGKYYEQKLQYQQTGLQGDKNKIRKNHGKKYRPYKRIIAPESQIHHEWLPDSAEYTGVALVEADQHMHGFVDVIEILAGKITLLTEAEVRRGGKTKWPSG